MDFSLTEEQLAVRDLAQKVLEEQSSNERLREIDALEAAGDESLWRTLAETGLLGVAVAEAHGGMGYDFETLCLLIEQVGRNVAAVPVVPILVGGALSLQHFGNEQQQKKWLPEIVRGQTMVSVAMAEPGHDEPLQPQTRAVQRDGRWQLSGSKHCVPYANRAARVLLAARTEQGLGLFLLNPNAEGVKLQPQHSTAGEPQALLELQSAAVEADDVLLVGPRADAALERIWQWLSAASCAQAVGVCERMLEITAQYVSEREQFGVKIGSFQAVGHRAANCYIDAQCLRLTAQQAISRLSRGENAERELLVAKAWVGDACHRISFAAQHLHGGMGVDRDYPLFRYCLWAKHLELTGGSTPDCMTRLGDRLAEDWIAAAG